MNKLNNYINRFYNLMESKMGEVRPLINEQTNDYNEVIENMGFIKINSNNYKHKTIKNLYIQTNGDDFIVTKDNQVLGKVSKKEKNFITNLESLVKSSIPSIGLTLPEDEI